MRQTAGTGAVLSWPDPKERILRKVTRETLPAVMVRARALAILTACLAAAASASASETRWLDLEGRIQYAYYTEDRRMLAGLAASLEDGKANDPFHDYYAALAHYRLAQLHAESDRSAAAASAERCAGTLDRVLRQRTEFVEALALQSICLAELSRLRPVRAALATAKSNAQAAKALRLAPANPRVLLLAAMSGYDRSRSSPEGLERAVGQLRSAVAAFERERLSAGMVPGWGEADAWLSLARAYLDQGDALAARSAIERALLVAPEFAAARRALTRITADPVSTERGSDP